MAPETDFDPSVPIRAQHPGSSTFNPLDDLWGRMAVWITSAGRHQSQSRPDGIQELRDGRRAAAMMGNLEDIASKRSAPAPDPGQKLPLAGHVQIAGEQRAGTPGTGADHERCRVAVGARIGPGMNHSEPP